MSAKTFIFAIISTVVIAAQGRADLNLNYQHYSVINGLSGNEVTQIVQHSSGVIYIATQNGLNRFDGLNFWQYKGIANNNKTERLTNNYITLIKEDSRGVFWLATKDHKLYRFDPTLEQYKKVELLDKELKPISEITAIAHLDGEIWVTTSAQGCFRISIAGENYNTETINTRNGLVSDSIGTIYRDNFKNRTLILTSRGVNIYDNKNGKISTLSLPLIKGESPTIADVSEIRTLFATSRGRIFEYLPSSGSVRVLAKPFASAIDVIALSANGLKVGVISYIEGFAVVSLESGAVTSKLSRYLGPGTALHSDKHSKMWIAPRKPEIIRYDLADNSYKIYPGRSTESNDLSYFGSFIESPNGQLIMRQCNGEIYYYDRPSNTINRFSEGREDHEPFLNTVKTWLLDSQNNLWMHTYAAGLDKITLAESDFKLISISTEKDQFINDARAIFQDSDSTLWVGTKDGRLMLLDDNYKIVGCINSAGNLVKSGKFSTSGIYSINQDAMGNIWVGSRGDGLFKLTKRGNTFNVERFCHNPSDKFSLNNDDIVTISIDPQGVMWLGTWGGGVCKVEKNEMGYRFIHRDNILKGYPDIFDKVRKITTDRFSRLWVVGQHCGILSIEPRKDGAWGYTIYNSSSTIPLSGEDVKSIYYTAADKLFIGSSDDGMTEFDLGSGKVRNIKRYNWLSNFPADAIQGIAADNQNNLWISAINAVVKFNTQSGATQSYPIDNLNQTQPLPNSILWGSNSKLIVGTTNGLLILDPERGVQNRFVPRIIFNRLIIYNREVKPGDDHGILTRELDNTPHIILKHSQSVFEIECAALDYRNPANIQYAFMLEGIDTEWGFAERNRITSFKSLPAGEYVLKVKSTDSNGIWMDNERSIKITVLNPFYKSTFAYIIYLLVIIGLIVLTVYILNTIYRLKGKVEMEKQLTEYKLNFFTTVSHEIRTPLTLIHTPLEHILASKKSDESLWRDLAIIYKNSGRLMKLINQLLDFRAAQHGKVEVRKNSIVIAELVASLADNFSQAARKRGITFDFASNCDLCVIVTDREKLETVIYNIISNAIKYSSKGKKIYVNVNLNQSGDMLSCQIRDEGVGIPPEDLKNVFDLFYRSSNSYTASEASTGIGLALVKEYCDLLGIGIEIASQVGQGTTVTLKIKVGEQSTPESEMENLPEIEQLPESRSEGTILIIEDDTELRRYLRTELSTRYTVIEAADGSEGSKIADEISPDLIITDLMMPNMSGIEFVEQFRSNISTNHIPIIVITAVDDLENKKRLFGLGVEAYITKPFVMSLLLLRIENVLEQRRRLRMLYSSNLTLSPDANTTLPPDKGRDLIELLNNYMNDNLYSADISVDDLCQASGLQYNQLKGKLKQLLGLNPIEFIREYRIQRAADLIRNNNYSMKEVTYMVGINDPRYFSRCFKERYGVSPTEYKNSFSNSEKGNS